MSVRLKELLSLPEAERAEIATALLDSLVGSDADDAIELAWVELARARASTTGQTLDADAHLADLESRYG